MEEDNQTVITIHGEEISVKEAMKRFGVDSIIKRFGAWVVTDYGIECLARSYPIELHRVEENDWLSHMREKRWVNMEDYTMAFVYAESLFQKRKKFILEDRQLKVFLCHGKEDKPKIREIYIELSRLGINVWLDEESLFPGQDWELEIRREVKKSDLVLVCLSTKSVSKTGFIQKEIKLALDATDERPEGDLFIIPARLDDCEVPDRLSSKQWVDLFDEKGFQRLITSLQMYCASK